MEDSPKPNRRWFRFSLRTMLVVVTLVCISVASWKWTKNWVDARRKEFALRAMLNSGHRYWTLQGFSEEDAQRYFKYGREVNAYRDMLYEKYRYAAQYPWLPVDPDPPEPQPPATQD